MSNLYGERVRALRREIGLTQQELAAQAGLSRDKLSKIETGARRFSSTELIDLAAALHVSPEALLQPALEVQLRGQASPADVALAAALGMHVEELAWLARVEQGYTRQAALAQAARERAGWNGSLPIDPRRFARALGVSVLALRAPDSAIRAGSAVRGGAQVLLYNAILPEPEQRHAAAHALAHLLKHDGREQALAETTFGAGFDGDIDELAGLLLLPDEALEGTPEQIAIAQHLPLELVLMRLYFAGRLSQEEGAAFNAIRLVVRRAEPPLRELRAEGPSLHPHFEADEPYRKLILRFYRESLFAPARVAELLGFADEEALRTRHGDPDPPEFSDSPTPS